MRLRGTEGAQEGGEKKTEACHRPGRHCEKEAGRERDQKANRVRKQLRLRRQTAGRGLGGTVRRVGRAVWWILSVGVIAGCLLAVGHALSVVEGVNKRVGR